MDCKIPLHIEKGLAICINSCQLSSPHQHYAMQLGFILEGDYKISVEGEVTRQSVFINSNVSHGHRSFKGKQLSLFIEPNSDLGLKLGKKHPVKFLELENDKKLLAFILSCLSSETCKLHRVADELYRYFRLDSEESTFDTRIERFLGDLEETSYNELDIHQMMAESNLSESRFRHLFKMHTRMSIKKYLLWKKLKESLYFLGSGVSLSEAAHNSGFSDYAHMNRTFNKMFGINPSSFMKNSHSVQDLDL